MAGVADFLKRIDATVAAPVPPRVGVQWQSSKRAREGVSPITMQINPNQVQFQQNKRIQKQDTINGTVYFHFSNQFGQNNDILTLTISGTTGNIDPRAFDRQVVSGPDITIDLDRTGAKNKVLAWASLYQMTLEPILDIDAGRPNLVTMMYASTLFPKPISFTGFFNNVMQFTESAQDPFQRQWSLQFVVQRTEPSLSEFSKYIQQNILSRQDARNIFGPRIAALLGAG
jgi:hypothetical protein